MSIYPERPDIIASEVWHYDGKHYRSSTVYIDMLGHSPEMTNHISTVSFKVISGVGAIATEGMVAPVSEGDEITVFPKNKYWYSGELSMLVEHKPAVHEAFVTHGDEKLAPDIRRSMRRLSRAITLEKMASSMLRDFDAVLPLMLKQSQAVESYRHLL